MLTERESSNIVRWVEEVIETGDHCIGKGLQGSVLLYEKQQRSYAIKVAQGRGLGRWVREWMLRREYRAYCRLDKLEGVPDCYGLVEGRYLVLEVIEGRPPKRLSDADHELYFDRLLALIRRLHDAGVAHGDLLVKGNVLVTSRLEPVLIDFGTAVLARRSGSRLNRFLFDLFKLADYSCWVLLKYGKPELAPPEHRDYYAPTIQESIRWIKRRRKAVRRAVKAVLPERLTRMNPNPPGS